MQKLWTPLEQKDFQKCLKEHERWALCSPHDCATFNFSPAVWELPFLFASPHACTPFQTFPNSPQEMKNTRFSRHLEEPMLYDKHTVELRVTASYEFLYNCYNDLKWPLQGGTPFLVLLLWLNNFSTFSFSSIQSFFPPESLSFLHDDAYVIQLSLLFRRAFDIDVGDLPSTKPTMKRKHT